MPRFPAILALFLTLSACAASPKPAPTTPMAMPEQVAPAAPDAPDAEPRPSPEEPPPPPPPPSLSVVTLSLPSPAWIRDELDDDDRRSHVVAKARNRATGAWYLVQEVPIHPSMGIETFAERMRHEAAGSGAEVADLVLSPDGKSASFYYEQYGAERRGKAFILVKPDSPVALLVQAMWPLETQHAAVPDIDAINASLDYTMKPKKK